MIYTLITLNISRQNIVSNNFTLEQIKSNLTFSNDRMLPLNS
jgi:hypothetical protein